MKIINQLTLRYLKQNKKRTIFTILSIVLSVTMINAVGISLNSGLSYYKETIEKDEGSYHYRFISDHPKAFELIKNDEQIKDYYFTNTKEYEYGNKKYLSLKKGDQKFYEKNHSQKMIIKGRLPKNSTEIIISQSYLKNNNIDKKIGDTITLKDDKKKSTFMIVGYMKEYSVEEMYSVSYNALSYVDLKNGESYTLSIEDKDVSKNIFSHVEELSKKIKKIDPTFNGRPFFNSSYLGVQGVFEEDSQSTFLLVYKLVAAILMVIVTASIIIIYQAFNLSTNDRVQYLGMLSSVGATPKQKRNSVYFEGMILTVISIPIGIILSYLGLLITFTCINQLEVISDTGVMIHTRMSLQYTLIAILLAVLTVFISLILPARKLSKITVIDALKKDDEIKVKRRKLRIGFIQRKLLKYEHQFAIKNYKRQGRRSKVIVLSLTISMILFVSLFSFTKQMYDNVIDNNRYDLLDVTVHIAANEKGINEFEDIIKKNDKVESYYYWCKEYDFRASIDDSYYKGNMRDQLISHPDNSTNVINDVDILVNVIDDHSFKKICKDNDVKFKGSKQALISDYKSLHDYNLKVYSFDKGVDKNFIKEISYVEYLDNDKRKIMHTPLFESIDYIKNDTYKLFDENGWITLIVPMSYFLDIDKDIIGAVEFCMKADQHKELCEDLKNLGYETYDFTQSNQNSVQMLLVMQIFVYGFIFLMIIFSILNIVNMMNASIDKRQKEFAMLLSVGMSSFDIKKMILYESMIYGFKTLLYGVPIGIIIEWFMYRQIISSNTINTFSISYVAYLISFIVIMLVMILTFKVGLKKLNKQNIIESLKDDM